MSDRAIKGFDRTAGVGTGFWTVIRVACRNYGVEWLKSHQTTSGWIKTPYFACQCRLQGAISSPAKATCQSAPRIGSLRANQQTAFIVCRRTNQKTPHHVSNADSYGIWLHTHKLFLFVTKLSKCSGTSSFSPSSLLPYWHPQKANCFAFKCPKRCPLTQWLRNFPVF